VSPYNSTLRSEQAAATRARVISVAGACFAEDGYTATTLRSIAGRAGVSVETVQATGAKRALLMAAFDQIFTGETDEKHFSERNGIAEALADPDTIGVMHRIARWIADGNVRVSGLWRAITAAAASDLEIAAYHHEHLARMRTQTAEIITALQADGRIDPPRTVTQTADLVWNAQLPDTRLRLVTDAGWTHEDYTAWLAETFITLCRPT
jgi:AcrR family transcriptional regulator